MSDWINRFFEGYAEAFRSRDNDAILSRFCLPLTFLTKEGPVSLDKQRLEANICLLIDRYDSVCAVDWRHTVKDIRMLGVGIALVDLEWRFFDKEKSLLYSCFTSYFIAGESEAEAKIMAIIAHNENEEYQKALNRKNPV
jgi:hypothetical protein